VTVLRISNDLSLPVDAVTQAMAILARRGAGKTYTGSVIVEEVISAQIPVVVLDPTGAWWGLRSSVDGEKPGLPVVIFGGDHGDVPLEPTAGAVLADVVVEHPGAYVLDLSGLLSKAAEQRFAADFLERLYRAKKRETGPLLVVVDEADVFAPQRPGPEQARTLGALESIVRRGRIKGLGDLLITQRAAVLNKNVLTQSEVLIAMQTTGPQDRAAIDSWVEGNGTAEERAAVMGSLASLERGEAWIWSPSFLRVLKRVRIRTRKTFDSSRTPEAGEASIGPAIFAKVDLEKLGQRIAATIKKQKADDPRELKKRIALLEAAARVQESQKQTDVAPISNSQIAELERALATTSAACASMREQLTDEQRRNQVLRDGIRNMAERLTAAVWDLDLLERVGIDQATLPSADDVRGILGPRSKQTAPPVAPAPRTIAPIDGDVSLAKADKAFLAALAQFPEGRTKGQAAFLAGYSPSVSTTKNALGRLRTAGLITGKGTDGDPLWINEAGLAALGDDWEPAPTGKALADYWFARLGKADELFLRALVDVYPHFLTKHEAAERAGYDAGVSTTKNALGRLRSLGLIVGGNDSIRASDDLVGMDAAE